MRKSATLGGSQHAFYHTQIHCIQIECECSVVLPVGVTRFGKCHIIKYERSAWEMAMFNELNCS